MSAHCLRRTLHSRLSAADGAVAQRASKLEVIGKELVDAVDGVVSGLPARQSRTHSLHPSVRLVCVLAELGVNALSRAIAATGSPSAQMLAGIDQHLASLSRCLVNLPTAFNLTDQALGAVDVVLHNVRARICSIHAGSQMNRALHARAWREHNTLHKATQKIREVSATDMSAAARWFLAHDDRARNIEPKGTWEQIAAFHQHRAAPR